MSSIGGLLSICRKAGKLVMGFDPMKDALAGNKACAVIIASDISPKTEKEVRFFSGKKNIPVARTAMTLDEVYYTIGKKAGILTICDKGFAEKALSICENENTDNSQ
ncbi:MAG: ribosomal L7Ae/L30e/S12e/Gadd45 family protein [Oscillospiraceae bacterium]|nr:ribosomal L7Ae/L30e/S12e/Gadd45 family protein [Oscillospiraceae bacterium]